MTKNVIEENKSLVQLLNTEKEHAKASRTLVSKKRHSYFYTGIYFTLYVTWGASSLQYILHIAWAACASVTANPFLRVQSKIKQVLNHGHSGHGHSLLTYIK